MHIEYPTKVRWRKQIHPDIYPDFGKSNTKKIKQLQLALGQTSISHTFEPLNDENIVWFENLYNKHILNKSNAQLYDVRATTLDKPDANPAYQLLSLYEGNTPIGGTIFRLRRDRLSMVYRVYSSTWANSEHDFRCSPALYAEYLATVHSLENGLTQLVHGQDRNLYGQNSSIGVAVFKLSVGCNPETNSKPEYSDIETNNIREDVLILQKPLEGKRITDATLVCSSGTKQKYEQLLKYEDQLSVATVEYDN